jgi:uncharacterized protein YkwD
MQSQRILHSGRRGIGAGALVVIACAAGAAPAGAATCPGAGEKPGRATRTRTVSAIVCLVNQERAGRGLRPLRAHSPLRRAATGHARDMVHRRFFSHTAPGGVTVVERLQRAGYIRPRRAWAVGETIAFGRGRLATPRAIVASWLRSAAHRRVLLGRGFRDVGLGVALGTPSRPDRGATYVADLGLRR